MRRRIIFALACAAMMVLMIAPACVPGESPTPTVPADAPEPPRPSWLRMYTDIDFNGPSLGLISGWHGKILRSVDTGQHWTEMTLSTTADLNGIAVLDATAAVAVGSGGNILRSTDSGLSWTKVESPTTETLTGVAGYSGGVVAVGWHGTIIRSVDGGKTWSKQPVSVDPSVNFEAVDFTPGGTGMTVSSTGQVFKAVGGTGWRVVTLPSTDQKLFAVDLFDDENALLAGNVEEEKSFLYGGKTVILKTEDGGGVWGYGPRNINLDLLADRFVDRRNAVAAGWEGAIIRTDDGGSNWSPMVSPTTEAIRALAMADATTIVAVGDGETIIQSRNGGYTWEKLRGD